MIVFYIVSTCFSIYHVSIISAIFSHKVSELNSKTKNVIYETKIYPDFSFNTIEDAIKDYIDNHAAIGNSILFVTLRMNSNYMGMIQIYKSDYASAFFIGYAATTPVYMQKVAGVWKYSIIQAESHPLS